MQLCKRDVEKLSKPADRSLKLLTDNIPTLPIQLIPIATPIVSPPTKKLLPDPVPILHQYKTRSVTRAQAHPLPRVRIPLPRVQHIQNVSVPRVKNKFIASVHNVSAPIISPLRLGNYNYKVYTGRLPSLPTPSVPKIIVPEVDLRTPDKIVYNSVAFNVENVFPKEFPKPAESKYYVIPEQLEAQWTANVVLDDDGTLLEYRHLLKRPKNKITWEGGMCNELGRLCNGYKNIKGTQTIKFISRDQVPKGHKVTYMRIVCDYKPNKSDPHRVRLCVGGDRLDYDGPLKTPTADLTTVNVHVNSTISTRGARYMTGDIKKNYLGTPLKNYEYAKFHRKNIPQDFIDANDLEPLFDEHGFIYMQIQKGMYGLKQAGKIANNQLKKFLAPHGYRPTRTPGLWKHDNKPIFSR